jgi:hypothetical protein
MVGVAVMEAAATGLEPVAAAGPVAQADILEVVAASAFLEEEAQADTREVAAVVVHGPAPARINQRNTRFS